MTSVFELTPPLFAILTNLVEERTGIHYGSSDLAVFASKLTTRAREAGFESPLDYYYFLRYDDPSRGEFDALVDALVVNETYFHREADQLKVLCEDVVKPLVESGKRPRIWCAAASTGEEPLSMAIMLADLGVLPHVDILASDISLRALARARAGDYGPRALRALPPAWRGRWVAVEGDRATVRAEIRDAVEFQRVNLLDTAAVAALGTFDAILCRNVLIYFSDETIVKVVQGLSDALCPRGRLLVGASESLLRLGTFLHCEERRGCFFYTKAAG